MIRRIVKLVFYVKAPLTAFTVFHPVKAAKLWFAYVLGSALFGSRARAERSVARSRWGSPEGRMRPDADAARGGPAVQASGNGGAGSEESSGPAEPAGEAEPAVPAGASVPEGHQPA
ncbi:MAG: hypothetical protein P8099_08740 [Gemmatimonadota bacterium]